MSAQSIQSPVRTIPASELRAALADAVRHVGATPKGGRVVLGGIR